MGGEQVVIVGFMKFGSCFGMDRVYKGLVMVNNSPSSELIFIVIAFKVNV